MDKHNSLLALWSQGPWELSQSTQAPWSRAECAGDGSQEVGCTAVSPSGRLHCSQPSGAQWASVQHLWEIKHLPPWTVLACEP